jgi:hypothetical protein
MKIDKQILRIFAIVTIMPIITAILGSFMNFVISCTVMCDFKDVQCSAMWVLHGIVGIIFTIILLEDEQIRSNS